MSEKSTIRPVALAVSATFVTTLAGAAVADATENPFALRELSGGYLVADMAEGRCGEGKCGSAMNKSAEDIGGDTATVTGGAINTTQESRCEPTGKTAGEGKCGGTMNKPGEGRCGAMMNGGHTE